MKWTGDCEAIINEIDDNGKVVREFRLMPGEEIPEYVEKILKDRELIVSETPPREPHKKLIKTKKVTQ